MSQSRQRDQERPPTLEDVAQRVKLSVATTGRALGGYGRISPATKERVLQAAKELNYHPNAIARGMKERRTRTIGLIVGNILNPFFSTIVRASEDTVSHYGFNVIVCNTDENPEKELAHAKILFERRVDGLIVAPTIFDNRRASEVVKDYYGKQVPTVFVDRIIRGIMVPSVSSDNAAGAYEATQHLLELGHKRIGVIVGKCSLTSMEGRIAGYKRALRDVGLEPDETLITDAIDVGVRGGYAATHELLKRQQNKPTALLALNNLLVVGALNALKEAELHVPKDMSLICWDDFELAAHLTPPLTVVDQPAYSIGSLAAEQLMKAITQNTKLEPLEVSLKQQLIVRQSTSRISSSVGSKKGARTKR
jgi:DNA-binding LacI/PurR family transcriptional regulator